MILTDEPVPRRRRPVKSEEDPSAMDDVVDIFNNLGRPILGGGGIIKLLIDAYQDSGLGGPPAPEASDPWLVNTNPYDWKAEPSGLQASIPYPDLTREPEGGGELPSRQRIARRMFPEDLAPQILGDLLKEGTQDMPPAEPAMRGPTLNASSLEDFPHIPQWWADVLPGDFGSAPENGWGTTMDLGEVERALQNLGQPPLIPAPDGAALNADALDVWNKLQRGEYNDPNPMPWLPPTSAEYPPGYVPPGPYPERAYAPQDENQGFWDWSGNWLSDINQLNPVEWLTANGGPVEPAGPTPLQQGLLQNTGLSLMDLIPLMIPA